MTILVTGSSGHLGEGLMRTFRAGGQAALGIDLLPGPFTDRVGSIGDRALLADILRGVATVFHAATLHKPHVASHDRQAFVDTNVTGTLALLEAAVAAGVRRFVFTSTTSAFGSALSPPSGAPAAWIDEDVVPVPRNIYGATKLAAEHLVELFARQHGLPAIVLRTSRFFPEEDDDPAVRAAHSLANAQVNELLYRRADLADVVAAHLSAAARAPALGFGRFIVSAATPFVHGDRAELRRDPMTVVERLFPGCRTLYARLGWTMFATIDRVYDSRGTQQALGWRPDYGFGRALADLAAGREARSPLARAVGAKGYHRSGAAGAEK
ncbi:NAD-dependent epimerase/dehydratase family protein [Marinibaculum pumilum]|uniref:NAD-dependent epimerase/dehydratase family protein n=1 Tax=Marinibaculum pumilum TaxID=1766165 RepID=A0ABV7L9N4_9PROT